MSGGDHWQRSGEDLLRALTVSEELVRREYAASLAVIAELDNRTVAAELGYPGLAELLRDTLRITLAEARRRISHAEALNDTPLVSGGTVPARLPAVAAASLDGVVGPDHIDVIAKTVRELPPHVPDSDREAAERTLVEEAHRFDARTLARIGDRIRAVLDQDGTRPDDRELAEPSNELHLTTRRNGRLAIRGDFDPEASALITAVVSPLAKPRPSSDTGPDPRSASERQGDALVEVVRLVADEGRLPSEGGEKPHILVTIPLHALRTTHQPKTAPNRSTTTDHNGSDSLSEPNATSARRPNHGLLNDVDEPVATPGRRPDRSVAHPLGVWGDRDGFDDLGVFGAARARQAGHGVLDGVGAIDVESARRIACDARIIPVVLGSRSEPLDIGRASYTVPTALRRALVLRDGGCAFPGCDRSHRWCHSHHIRHWADDGPTELGNLVLLCGRHHRLIHHSEWDCAIVHGRAEFRPPRFVDAGRASRWNVLHAAAG